MKMYQSLQNNDSILFIKSYQQIDSLEIIQKNIISRGFKGSIKSPNPKPANEVVAPFIKQMKSMLVAEYKRSFNYKKEIFPRFLLDDGRYYIMHNGKYLTNQKDTYANPVFVSSADTINPQRQEWMITIDPMTDRYKITNAQDSHYLNELGKFGTNKYEAGWNTFTLYLSDGKYALQNGGSAGTKFWTITSEGIRPSQTNKISDSDYLFEIIPVEGGR